MKKRKKWVLLTLGFLLLCLIIPGFWNGLAVRHYSVETGRSLGQELVRLALVTDLHSCSYGKGMKTLINEIEKQNPDVILLGGDIFDDQQPDDNTETFLAGISGMASVFYVTGNHEYWSGEDAFKKKMSILDRYGVVRLSGTASEIEGLKLIVCGVDDPCEWTGNLTGYAPEGFLSELSALSQQIDPDRFAILLTHRPEFFDLYCRYGFELALAGHAHGGQWRIPGLLNGFYAPNQGFFPDFAGGQYERDGTVMIVSRGLARETTRIPRFYNPPELVIIDLK